MSLAALAGGLTLELRVVDGRVAAVAASAPRPLLADKALRGRSPDEARKLAPLLFSLCAAAHRDALESALADAQGIEPPSDARAERRRARLLERAQTHGWRFIIDAPRLLGDTPDPAAAQQLRQAATGPALHEALLALGFPAVAPETRAALATWAQAGAAPAARLFHRLLTTPEIARFGAAAGAIPCLPPEADAAWFAERCAADPHFAARPRWAEGPAEVGPFAHWRDHPLIRELVATDGPGLLARFSARLLDLLAVPEALSAPLPAWRPSGAPAGAQGPRGVGLARCARGPLAYVIELRDAVLAAATVVAPTEWSCAADGALVTGLIGAAAGPDLAARAELFAAAVDPCVPWALRLS